MTTTEHPASTPADLVRLISEIETQILADLDRLRNDTDRHLKELDDYLERTKR